MLTDRVRSEVGNGTRKVWIGVGESAKINELLRSKSGDEKSNETSDELGVGVMVGEGGGVEGAELGDGDRSCEDTSVVVRGNDDMLVGKRKMGVNTDVSSDTMKLEDSNISEKTGVIPTSVIGSTSVVRGTIVMATMVVSGNTMSVDRLGDGDGSCDGTSVVGRGRDDMLVGRSRMGVDADVVSDVTNIGENSGVISTSVIGSTSVVRGTVVMGTMVVSGNTMSVVRLGDGDRSWSCEDMSVVVGGRDGMLVGKRRVGVETDVLELEDTKVGEKTGVISACVVGSIIVDRGTVVMGTTVVSGNKTSVVSSGKTRDVKGTGVGVKMSRDSVTSDSDMGMRIPLETVGRSGRGVELGSRTNALELDCRKKVLVVGSGTKELAIGSLEILGCRTKVLEKGSRRKELAKSMELGSRRKALELMGDGVSAIGMEEKRGLVGTTMLERTVKGKEGVGVMTTSTMDVETILNDRLAMDSTGTDVSGSNV